MSSVEDELIEAMSRVALDDIMAIVVKRMEEVRTIATALEGKAESDSARALHQLSVGLDRLQRHVARMRDRKIAKLLFKEKWSAVQIARRTGIERSLVWKMAKRGAKS